MTKITCLASSQNFIANPVNYGLMKNVIDNVDKPLNLDSYNGTKLRNLPLNDFLHIINRIKGHLPTLDI
jgi:hypothetical protein